MTAVASRGSWAMPDGRIVLPADAPRPRWLAERRKGIGGSDASTVVGVNRWSSRYELWLDKTGRRPERESGARMEAGVRMEPVMRQWFTDERGISADIERLLDLEYADAERLLRDWCRSSDPLGPRALAAARLRCWIADTKPLAVKAGWNDDDPGDDWHELVNMLPSPRPSLWQRTPEWALWLGTAVLIVALLALPVIA